LGRVPPRTEFGCEEFGPELGFDSVVCLLPVLESGRLAISFFEDEGAEMEVGPPPLGRVAVGFELLVG